MNDTPTPETDGKAYVSIKITADGPRDGPLVVPADFARQLERELTEALDHVEHMKKYCMLKVGALQNQTCARMLAEFQRDTLAQALRECREDSVELLGERDWWQNETRLDYQKRYQETRENVTRADEALDTLKRTL
jgi:hypothetical protein